MWYAKYEGTNIRYDRCTEGGRKNLAEAIAWYLEADVICGDAIDRPCYEKGEAYYVAAFDDIEEMFGIDLTKNKDILQMILMSFDRENIVEDTEVMEDGIDIHFYPWCIPYEDNNYKELSRDRLAKNIAIYLQAEGSMRTSEGNWCIYFEEIDKLFGTDIGNDKDLQEEVEYALDEDMVAIDSDTVQDDCFDLCFYLWCCPCADED